MSKHCVLCGAETPPARYCFKCGALQPEPLPAQDPLIGTMVADRYLIEALISSGGMGRVYRAVQQTLDRLVAVKIIDPRTLSVKNAADMTARFMTEARAASRLNHPNVVSVFDFGRTSSAEHAPLFLAMALLAGPSLADVLEGAVVPLPLLRVVSILRQTLAALGEAHHVGITHRDVKPANVILQRRRDQDHVSVIDFGVARIGSERKVTGRGELLGTPQYMAPELILSDAAGPSVDLYAVGVILYEMLTGRVPFNGETALKVCYMQTSAPRPDPREIAPHVPDALAEVCLRAIAVDPAARFPDAQALAEAIADAASIPITRAQASVFPPRVSSKVPPLRGASARPPSHAPTKGSKSVAAPAPPSEREVTPLVGREEALAWGRERLADPRVRSVVYWGKAGTGRSRMLRELSALAARSGAEIVRCDVERGPKNEVGYALLRGLVARLAGHEPNDSHLVGGHAADDRGVSTGLREMFGTPGTTLATEPGEVRTNVVAALAWAAQKCARAAGRPVIVVIDDVDKIDGVSRACLWEFLGSDGVPNVVVLAASEQEPPATTPSVGARELLGLSREEAAKLLSPASTGERPSIAVEAKATNKRVEPLYIEQYRRWRAERSERAPTGLREIVEARINELDPAPRRTLQALAVGGSCTIDQIAGLIGRSDGLEEAVAALEDAGFAARRGDEIRLTHEMFARVALDNAPLGVVSHLHEQAAELLAAAPIDVERRAYHRLRARPSLQTFLLVEKTARLRSLRGDIAESIAALSDGYAVARQSAARGDMEGSGWHVLGRKLGAALRDAGRVDQARGVLVEVLQGLGPSDSSRVAILNDLAGLASSRGLQGEADRWLREADDVPQSRRIPSGGVQVARRAESQQVRMSKRPSEPTAKKRTQRPTAIPRVDRVSAAPKARKSMAPKSMIPKNMTPDGTLRPGRGPQKEPPTRVARRPIEDEPGVVTEEIDERAGSKRRS